MIQEIAYGGWERNLRIHDGKTELILTLDVGPRILFGAPIGGKNLFAEIPEQLGKKGEKTWQIRGGHRFWTAPENDESYSPDNEPVTYRAADRAIEITSPATPFGWQKTLHLAAQGEGAYTVTHTLRNVGKTPLDATPWALSVMAPGGTAIVPQPEPKLHPGDLPPGTPFTNDDFQANRRLVLWKYTHLTDPRLRAEPEYWFVEQRPNTTSFKLGLFFRDGWVAYQLGNAYFAKTVPVIEGANYPDDGCNFELFTNHSILELETLAPLAPLPPGQSRTHVENWKIGTWEKPITNKTEADKFFQTLRG